MMNLLKTRSLGFDLIRPIIAALLFVLAGSAAHARPVSVEEGQGNGFLFNHRGVCYLILPSHVHGRGPVRLTARDPSGLGTGRVIDKSNQGIDLSLAVVSGSLSENCGGPWSDLPRTIDPQAGQAVTVVRYEQGSVETIRSLITTKSFTHFNIAPHPDETRFYAGGTSGSFVFAGNRPFGMVVEAKDRQDAYVLRIDEIHTRLRRVVEDWYEEEGCTIPADCDPLPEPAPATLSGFKLTGWSQHPVSGDVSPEAMAAGDGPYIAPIARNAPVILTFEADAITPISRIVLTSQADQAESYTPKLVMVRIDTSSDGIDRWRDFRSPRDMTPGAALDLKRGTTNARRVQIEIRSSWGGSPVRIDSVSIE